MPKNTNNRLITTLDTKLFSFAVCMSANIKSDKVVSTE